MAEHFGVFGGCSLSNHERFYRLGVGVSDDGVDIWSFGQ